MASRAHQIDFEVLEASDDPIVREVAFNIASWICAQSFPVAARCHTSPADPHLHALEADFVFDGRVVGSAMWPVASGFLGEEGVRLALELACSSCGVECIHGES